MTAQQKALQAVAALREDLAEESDPSEHDLLILEMSEVWLPTATEEQAEAWLEEFMPNY